MLFYPLGRKESDSAEMLAKMRAALGDENPHSPHSFYPQFECLPNVKRITENDFWWHVNHYSPKAWVYAGRQVNKIEIDGVSDWRDMTLFWDDHSSHANGGYAVVWCYNKKTTHYFSWCKCDHDFHGKTVGNCLTQYTCSKCGSSHEIDSSG